MEKNDLIKMRNQIASEKVYFEVIKKFFGKINGNSRQDLTKKCGLGDSTVTNWNKGLRKQTPELPTFIGILYGLELSDYEILTILHKSKEEADFIIQKLKSPPKKITTVK